MVIVLGLVGPLHATSVRRLSFDELIQSASSIVEGSILDARTYRSADGKLILTSYTISVQENLKGSSSSALTVTTIGGRIGNTLLYVSGMPVFQPGERAVLFLEKAGAYTTVVGLNQGKFAITNGEVVNSVSGSVISRRRNGKAGKNGVGRIQTPNQTSRQSIVL